MINLTDGEIVFGEKGIALNDSVRGAMFDASFALLNRLDLTRDDLANFSRMVHPQAAYAWLSLECTLSRSETNFDENFVKAAFTFYKMRREFLGEDEFYALTLAEPGTKYEFRRFLIPFLKRGIAFFLIAMHCRGALTLPVSFVWPQGLSNVGDNSTNSIFSELLGFLHTLEPNSDQLPHPSFGSVGNTKKRKEWFLTYGGKLLLATGWKEPADANLDDLRAIKTAESSLIAADATLAYKSLIDVFRSRFGTAFGVTVDDWSAHLRSPRRLQERSDGTIGDSMLIDVGRTDADVLAEIVKAAPSSASIAALRFRQSLPGLNIDVSKLSSSWVALEELYMKTVQRENYKVVVNSLAYLNIYLFFYLPYWFHRNPQTKFQFPDVPCKLMPTVFVSRLLPISGDTPKTFVEVMDMTHLAKKWGNNTYYCILKQVEIFFEFLDTHSEDLPDCQGFRQPIPDYAYPRTARSRGTNKRPIPRRIFNVLLDYLEALRAHSNAVLSGVISGSLDISELERDIRRTGNIIDTFATAAVVGFIPVLFAKGKTIPLRYIPNVLCLEVLPVGFEKNRKIPQPHALNQILAALYTGLRHNHIQWLDAETFDCAVTDEDREFTRLHVNTDKSMQTAWRPHVNFRVIEILRNQRNWRALIQRPAFSNRHHYNDNSQTKWATILPLFSADLRGLPHHDARYSSVWRDIISAMDGLLPELGEQSMQRLSSLEPPSVNFSDALARTKRSAYGRSCDRLCKLSVKSSITPHSTRVTVVSQLSTLLPAELIGAAVTGQTPGVVNYYVKLEAEEIVTMQTQQAMAMREKAYRNAFETMLDSGSQGMIRTKPGNFIHADNVNSNLARSLRANLQETLISYGCISITMNEDAISGLDVLRETRAANAAENKTEICPYGNHCPPEIIKQWHGVRRCGLCQYAVRSIDHLPAVVAKCREFMESLMDLTAKIEKATTSDQPRYSEAELDRLDEERCRLAEELAGWQLSEEVLNAARVRIVKGQDDRRWVVQKPEIILRDLQRVESPSNMTVYVLARLGECIAYPTSESAAIRARFDLLRRELLARTGNLREAFNASIPPDPAAECAGLLRSLVQANHLSYDDLVELLESDGHLSRLPARTLRLINESE